MASKKTKTTRPPGVKIKHFLKGHQSYVVSVAVTPDGRYALSGSKDKTVKVWDIESGVEVRTLSGHSNSVRALAVTPDSRFVLSGSDDHTVKVWDIESGVEVRTLAGHSGSIYALAVTPDSRYALGGATDRTVKIWDIESGVGVRTLEGHSGGIYALAVTPDGRYALSGSNDKTVRFWDIESGVEVRTLSGHNGAVRALAVTPDGRYALSGSEDNTVKVWDIEIGFEVRTLSGHSGAIFALAVTPDGRYALSGSRDNTVKVWDIENGREILTIRVSEDTIVSIAITSDAKHLVFDIDSSQAIVLELDFDVISGALPEKVSAQYTNAKVVLVGETSTGKTCLVRALMDEPFKPQKSTHGMKVQHFHTEKVTKDKNSEITREIFLWDLAGQTDYQVVHQLFLDETSLGIVMFDPTHPENPFGGVGHWEKALLKTTGDEYPKLLVAGRVDRGHPTATDRDIELYIREHDFQKFIATSATTGQGVEDLREALMQMIPWDKLSITSSPKLWKDIRDYLLKRRKGKDILTRRSDLRESFRAKHPDDKFEDSEFDTVIGHAQKQGLIWPLSFGDFVLLKPELLNSYASIIVLAARKQEDGLGSIRERDVLEATIDFEDMKRIADHETERSLLHAVVELFLEKEVALRQGEYLVFPSKYNRERPKAPEPPKRDVAYRFEGAVEDIYATLVVRLYYCEVFEKDDLWKDAAWFCGTTGGLCGIELTRPKEGQGEISVFFGDKTTMENKVLFLRFIHEHLQKRAVSGTFVRERIYRCPECGEEIENKRAVQVRLEKGKKKISCQFCDEKIKLIDLLEEKFGDPELLKRVRELDEGVEEKKDQAVSETTIKAKEDIGEYDVFLCYNSDDKAEVVAIANRLKEVGIRPWLDVWDAPPFISWQDELQEVILNIKSAAVFVGSTGIGPWEDIEIKALLPEFAKRKIRMGLVLLPKCSDEPDVPTFMNIFHRVDFRQLDPDPFDQLVWGITGNRPERDQKGRTPH